MYGNKRRIVQRGAVTLRSAVRGRTRRSLPPPHRPTGDDMPRIVRAALLQTDWAGDKESMIDKHEAAARDAAAEGAQVICFQELFYGPYFCQVQDTKYYDYTEQIPDGPTTQRFQSLAKELGMVMVLPMYEIVQAGVYYNTAAVDRRRRHATSASSASSTSPRSRASGRSSTSGPATAGTRSSTPPSARSACTSATTATSPRAGGSSGSTAPRSCSTRRPRTAGCPSTSGASSSRRRPSPTCTTSGRSTASASRPTSATTTSTARATSSTPRASSSATSATRTSPS